MQVLSHAGVASFLVLLTAWGCSSAVVPPLEVTLTAAKPTAAEESPVALEDAPPAEPKSKGKKGSASDSTRIVIDGSSTVYPITSAAADEFKETERTDANISVGLSGTGGGFKKFEAGEIDICNASRPVKAEEKEKLKKAKIEYIEFTIAQDGMAVVTHKDNDWVDCITVKELKAIWAPANKASGKTPPKKWKDVNPAWPDEEMDLYGAGTDSGTFEFFTEAIVGKAKESRSDYNPSENDSQLVTGVAGSRYSLGYFGLGYYMNNKDRLKLLAIDNGDGKCVKPSVETVVNGTYKPLSRPLFIYVRKDSLKRPIVKEFVEYYLNNAAALAEATYFVAPSEETVKKDMEILAKAVK